jgi:hypothetical protein
VAFENASKVSEQYDVNQELALPLSRKHTVERKIETNEVITIDAKAHINHAAVCV